MSKPGSGGVSSSEQYAIDRRSRLRALAADVGALRNDPYVMRNHLGAYECKLCLSVHTTEVSYLNHSTGRKHRTNLARRQSRLAQTARNAPSVKNTSASSAPLPSVGRCGYKLIKQFDPETKCDSLLLQLNYPLLAKNRPPSLFVDPATSALIESVGTVQPRYAIVSTYQQRVEPPNADVQYIVVTCAPYDTVGIAIPNRPVKRSKIMTDWNAADGIFMLQCQLET